MATKEAFDALVVGAGFGGVQMLHEFQKLGLSACGIEGGHDVGGAWYWNTYPGARCDVESLAYCYSFDAEIDAKWRWSERYPAQEEIQRYIAFAADLWNVRKDIRFNRWLKTATYDEAANCWTAEFDTGERVVATYLIMATGPLTTANWPEIEGLEEFKGERVHTARWPKGAALAGKRIGVIGNGSSGTQFMTEAAKSAREIHAYVRTPHYSVPAFNRPLGDADYDKWLARRDELRAELHRGAITGAGDLFADRSLLFGSNKAQDYSPEEQQERLEQFWNMGGAQLKRAFSDSSVDDASNTIIADFARAKVRATIADPFKRDVMTPRHFAIGGKRIIVDTGFYEIFNQPNVHVHDIRANPIVRVSGKGVVTTQGEVELDMLVCATGFDAAAGTFRDMDVRGRRGLTLKQHWADGAKSHFGILVHDFPNLFMVNGPGAPGPFSNVVISNEWCIEAIVALIGHMRKNGLASAEATSEAEEQWMELVEKTVAGTFFARTESWYSGANVAGKRTGIVNLANSAGFRQHLSKELAENFPHIHFTAANAEAVSAKAVI